MVDNYQQEASILYIEDEEEWQIDVKDFIERVGRLHFTNFIFSDSIDSIEPYLIKTTHPIVILMDLRLEQKRPNFEGYHWLLEQYEEFKRKYANTEVFVISGQLNEGIEATLRRRGIPHERIYNKGSWSEQRTKFLAVLKEQIRMLSEKNGSDTKIDPYVADEIESIAEDYIEVVEEAIPQVEKPILIPIIVRTKEDDWDSSHIPDLIVLGNIGYIYTCLGSARTIEALENDPLVIRVEASRQGGAAEVADSLPFVKATNIQQQLGERGDKCLVAVIDSDIDVLHMAFRDESGSKTRIISVWDQTDPMGPPPSGMSVGTEHTNDKINEYIETENVPGFISRTRGGHGTHVASIAAGRSTSAFTGGVAPEAKLVIVIPDLEFISGKPQSLGYSASHLLALEYIKNIAQRENLPVVINVSQGMNAGAHDGTSNLEKGFDLITGNGQDPGVVVVKSAGNERGNGGHASLQMMSHSSSNLRWESIPQFGKHHRQEVVELWFNSSDRFRFRLWDPFEDVTEWIDWSNNNISSVFKAGDRYFIAYTRFDRDNGDSRLLIKINSGKGKSISEGIWKLEIESGSVKSSGEVNAWLERSGQSTTRFVEHLSDEITLSIPGTARYVISVGSVFSRTPYKLADYSSYGPTRDGRYKPDLSAPGEMIKAAQCNTRDGVIAMRGTSMAAPHVTGAIALLFSYCHKHCMEKPNWQHFNAAQVLKAITQMSQNFSGDWHIGMGYGILDIEKLIIEFGRSCS